MNRKEEILAKVQAVPSLPTAAVEVIRLLKNADVNIGELVRKIEYDPSLTSNMLRMANSAYFGCPRSIATIRDAVVRLGTNNIFRLAMAATVAPVVGCAVRGYDLPAGDLWDHSMAVAIGTDKLAAARRLSAPPHAFTAGLLHDIGKVVLGTFVEVDAEMIKKTAYDMGESFETAEQKVLGVDHAEVGAALLEGWNLPASVVELVRWHHQPERVAGDPAGIDLVHVSDALCLMSGIGMGIDGLNYRASPAVAERLSLNAEACESIVYQILSELEVVRVSFGA